MDVNWASELIDVGVLLGAIGVLVSGAAGAFVLHLRNRLRVLRYTVRHDVVALSSKHPAFGEIKVLWGETPITNLWLSRVELVNDSNRDFEGLEVRIFTRDESKLLGQQAELLGSTAGVEFTKSYIEQLKTGPDEQPSQAQINLFNHRRHYLLPVFNRRQKAVWMFLTSVQPTAPGAPLPANPLVWLEVSRVGVTAQFQPLAPMVLGVPVKIAVPLGMCAALGVLVVSSLLATAPWQAAVPSAAAALYAQLTGAWLYRLYKELWSIVFH